MKKGISLIALLALVCFTSMVFAADAAPAKEKAPAEKAEVIKGKITMIDAAANTIEVKGKTFTVKPEDMAPLKKGEMVKITAAAGTLNAEKIQVIKAKKSVKKAKAKLSEEKTEEKAAEKKAD